MRSLQHQMQEMQQSQSDSNQHINNLQTQVTTMNDSQTKIFTDINTIQNLVRTMVYDINKSAADTIMVLMVSCK